MNPNTRRRFLHRSALAVTALALHPVSRAAAAPSLTLSAATIPDPDGHHPALRLQGDWLVISISDERYSGLGEISHSLDDAACLRRVRELFSVHIASRQLSREFAVELANGAFATAPDFVTATAISGLDQALHDLVAQREGVPVWQLFATKPAQDSVPCYLSTNRALRSRAPADFVRATAAALALGVAAVG